MAYSVLIIEDESVLARKMGKYLEQAEFEVRICGTGAEGLQALESFQPDAVLLDFNLPGELNGIDVLARIRQYDSGVKVILVTGHGNLRLAVDAMKAGAYDYMSKPVVLSEIKLLLDKAAGQERIETQLSHFKDRQASSGGLDKILGESSAVHNLKQRIRQIVNAEYSLSDGEPPAVLVTGETGSGKELIARSLHFDGPRKDKPFIELNAATIPAHLVESELFGYERGAFTDARERKIGLVEAADGGTLFLDEIGELHLNVQAKLLKLLEDRVVRRLGSVRDRIVDIRVITATNRNLEDMVADGSFRSDLYYRLKILLVESPPLRNRENDAELLAGTFLAIHGRRYGKPDLQLSEAARGAIRDHSWPGNVRELRNMMEQAALLADTNVIEAAVLALPEARRDEHSPPGSSDRAETTGETVPPIGKFADAERDLIARTLTLFGGNVSRTAEHLGITRDRLRYRIEKYGLDRSD